MSLRERIMLAIKRAEETGAVRESCPMLDTRPAENLSFLLTVAAAQLHLDELCEDEEYDLLRVAGPDVPREVAFDALEDWEKRAVVAVSSAQTSWKDTKPKVAGWLAKLEALCE